MFNKRHFNRFEMISLKTILTETSLDIAQHNIRYHNSGKVFTVEMSQIKNALRYRHNMKDSIALWNSKTGKSMEFKFVKIDYSGIGSDREIGGWEYKSNNGIKLVIVND